MLSSHRLSAARLLALFATLAVIPTAASPDIVSNTFAGTETKLTPFDGFEWDEFGFSVSISGETAVVGSPSDDDDGEISGAVYVYENTGGSWNFVQKLTVSDGIEQREQFGISVSVDEYFAVIGADGDDDQGQSAGAAYVFERIAGMWTQVAKLTASDGAAGDTLGQSVSISGGTVFVGADSDDNANGNSAGATYVFEETGGAWTEVSKLVAPDGADGHSFGSAVSVRGDQAIVSARFADGAAATTGAAYLFERVAGVWTFVAKVFAADGVNGDRFGISASISESTAVVGTRFHDHSGNNAGAAFVFERFGGVWMEVAELVASDSMSGDEIGYSVSVFDDLALIGSRFADGNAIDSGAAYLFQRGDGSWSEVGKLTAADGAAFDLFGFAVSLSGSNAVIGAFNDIHGAPDNNAGSAYVFELDEIEPPEIEPSERIENLIHAVNLLSLGDRRRAALVTKLERALLFLENERPHRAINRLNAFADQVAAFERRGILTPEQAEPLIAEAHAIVDAILASQ